MDVSVSPSVLDQPWGHLVRSIVKPAGPVALVPSDEVPQPLSLICFSIAVRCCAHSASHWSMDVGRAAGAVVVVEPPATAVVAVVPDAPPVVDVPLLDVLLS